MGHKFVKTLESLDSVPEPFRAFYKQAEAGGYEMPDEVFTHLDNSKLSLALDNERKRSGDLDKVLKSFKAHGETPEAIAERIARAEELANKAPSDIREMEKRNKETAEKFNAALAAKDTEIANGRKELESYLLESQALAALAVEECDAPELVMAEVHKNSRVEKGDDGRYHVRVIDNEGDPRGDGKGGYMSLRDFAKELRAHPVFGRAFKPTGIQGSGMPPRSGKQPIKQSPADMTPNQKIAAGLAIRDR